MENNLKIEKTNLLELQDITKNELNLKKTRQYASKFNQKILNDIPAFDFDYYDSEFKELIKICENLSSEKIENKALKNYVLIRTVGIIENEFKAIITELVDYFKLVPSKILGNDDLKINIDRLNEFITSNPTQGKIVTMNFSTQNAKDLGHVLSNINQVKFFSWFEEIMGTVDDNKHWFNYINDIFMLRNRIVHSLSDYELDEKILIITINNIRAFANLTYILSCINLMSTIDNKIIDFFEIEFEMKFDKFVMITKKCKDEFRRG